jgi:hypothetical protein
MNTVEVITNDERQEFHDFPKRLYKGDPCWVCPLDSIIESIFDPRKNHSFEHGEAIRWILKDDDGKTIGRVAAFIDNVKSAANRQKTGGMGFFEVIEDKDAAFFLFNKAKEWLSERGMEAMDGPINFGENDSFWGLLVDGFTRQAYGMPFNKKYYKKFFEEYGFRNYFEQISCHRVVREKGNVMTNFPERIMKVAEWLTKRPGYSFRHFEFSNARKFIDDICHIYNTTWIYLKDDFTPLDPAILQESLASAKPVLDEDLVWFAYYNDSPIGFFVMYPDLNMILRHFNGKLTPWNLIRFVYYKLTHEMNRVRTVVGGVIHSHQNTGVEAALFYQYYLTFIKKPWIKELDMSWVGDYNPKMIATYEALGAKKVKTHVTYRYMINDKLKFKRFKDEMAEKNAGLYKNRHKDQ